MKSSEQALVELGQRYLYPNYRQPPFVLARGQGNVVWDLSGKRYLDFFAGIAVSVLGHAHPALVAAIREQAARLIHVSNYFFNEPNLRLAEMLCRATGMDRAFFCNSGTEAIEASLKLVRHHFWLNGNRERMRVVAFQNAFHGRTLGALAVTGTAKYRDGFGSLPQATHVPYGDLDAVSAAMGSDVAAILVEPIQGEAGVIPAPPGFLPGLRKIADAHGAFLIADEIQTGLGRTGAFLGFQRESVIPDVVALAKGLAGGLPIGAMLCREALSSALPPGSHGSTFGGNPLASAAALAVLETLDRENLIRGAARSGEILSASLSRIQASHPHRISATRGVGLLQALVLAEGIDARAVLGRLQDEGLLVTLAGQSALRFSPSLTISEAEIREAMHLLERVLEAL